MSGEMLVIRKTNKRIYRRFKHQAVEEDMNLGDAINEAMKVWIELKSKRKKPDFKNIHKLNGIIKVGKKVNWSNEIDATVYGGKI